MRGNIKILATIDFGDSDTLAPRLIADNVKKELANYDGVVTVTAYWDEVVTTAERQNFTA